MRMHLIILSDVACFALTYFSPYPTKGAICEKEIYVTKTVGFEFLYIFV